MEPDMPKQEVIPEGQQDSQTAADSKQTHEKRFHTQTFDTCTQPFGPLRQSLFSCLTCNPPPASLTEPYAGAGICYSCSIACHGEHELVELFNKRNFVCDCGTTRLPASTPCSLRISALTGLKGGAHSEAPAPLNKYDRNFRNVFCACAKVYDASKERGTMFQCLGLASAEEGGCGEDWWHPGCLVGLGENWEEGEQAGAESVVKRESEHTTVKIENTDDEAGIAGSIAAAPQDDNPQAAAEAKEEKVIKEEEEDIEEEPRLPPTFPPEDAFDAFICYKCIGAHPWLKRYAGTPGFLPAVYHTTPKPEPEAEAESKALPLTTIPPLSPPPNTHPNKRKALSPPPSPPSPKRATTTARSLAPSPSPAPAPTCHYHTLPPSSSRRLSLFLTPTFRASLCKCATCLPLLTPHPVLLAPEDTYSPPLSEPGDDNDEQGRRSLGSRSLLDRGEAALSTMDRVQAIESVMAFNAVKEQLKTFLQPFAASGRVVAAEDIRRCFEQLRGDAEAVRAEREAAEERRGF
ncbi:MAG: hypothetical protein M1829_005761 [Trizodia sp. TS-e1964]|nr:MAG: hypothetical protein M1829_005761 [Trizodia sp. TS-e1964]